jgi:hypothetical protein
MCSVESGWQMSCFVKGFILKVTQPMTVMIIQMKEKN